MLTPPSALEIGKAAEHLVCADLLMQGVPAFLSDQGMPFDVIAPVGDRLIRIQVKATLQPKSIVPKNGGKTHRSHGYQFHVRRRGRDGKGSRLSDMHCDIVALVALDVRAVAYLPVNLCSQTVTLFPVGHVFKKNYRRARETTVAELPFFEALAVQCLV